MNNKANQKIRMALKENKVPVWMLADRFGKSENTLFRMLRHELEPKEQDRIISMIVEIVQERKSHGAN